MQKVRFIFFLSKAAYKITIKNIPSQYYSLSLIAYHYSFKFCFKDRCCAEIEIGYKINPENNHYYIYTKNLNYLQIALEEGSPLFKQIYHFT